MLKICMTTARAEENGSPEVRMLEGKLSVSSDGARRRLMYRQIAVEGEDPVPETAMAETRSAGTEEDDRNWRLIVTRPGMDYRLVFDPAEVWITEFDTPAGRMDVRIDTKKVEIGSREWKVVYQLTLGDQDMGITSVTYSF